MLLYRACNVNKEKTAKIDNFEILTDKIDKGNNRFGRLRIDKILMSTVYLDSNVHAYFRVEHSP